MPFGEEAYIGVGNRAVGHGYTYGDSTRQKFTGYERDEETNLDFAQARMHNYNHGRFTSPDPYSGSANLADPQSLHRYSYALNNPNYYTDPTGLMACPEGKNCETDDQGNEYYVDEKGIVVYTAPVAFAGVVVEVAKEVADEKVIIHGAEFWKKTPWWKKALQKVGGFLSKAFRPFGVAFTILANPVKTGCGASPGMKADGNGGCVYDAKFDFPIRTLPEAELTKGGKQNQRDSGLKDVSDEEVLRKSKDKSLDAKERQRYIKEAKARRLRNSNKDRGGLIPVATETPTPSSSP